MIMAYVIGIYGKKRPVNLVLITHKYSQGNTNTDMKIYSRYNQKVKKLNGVCKIVILVKN